MFGALRSMTRNEHCSVQEPASTGSLLSPNKNQTGTNNESKCRRGDAALWHEAGSHVNLEDVERNNLLGKQVDRPDGAR
eukprot:4759525-Pleurochrysis_carterae.AAC.2